MATLLALALKNSPLVNEYDALKQLPVTLQLGSFAIDKPLLLWINDGLMAIFFLLVGLEIKREILGGHLSDRSKLALPIAAALGGMIAPALLYTLVNSHDPGFMRGWAIPMATDIAFALGILALLGERVPLALRVCLAAAAIIDDLGAIIIIALFYTAETSALALGLAGTGFLVLCLLNRCGVTKLGPYLVIGLFMWACVLKSGVHATLAGVALGLTIPLRTGAIHQAKPLIKLEHALHPWVSFLILPVFAFANAGLPLAGLTFESFLHPVALGTALGLFVGKQSGVMLFTWVAIQLRLCRLPDAVSWRQYYGMALLMGIGFTMSLFIGTLAFHEPEILTEVRLGVLSGSLLSGIAGCLVLRGSASRIARN